MNHMLALQVVALVCLVMGIVAALLGPQPGISGLFGVFAVAQACAIVEQRRRDRRNR